MIYLLTQVDVELILILRERFLYPKNEEDFFKVLNDLDKEEDIRNRLLSKSFKVYRSIVDLYKEKISENGNSLEGILNSII